MADPLVEKIFDSIRNEEATGFEKVCALIRAGNIAHAYVGESKDMEVRVSTRRSFRPKVPYRYIWIPKRRKPMTAIVGLVCEEGIVVASESQESDENAGMKRLDVTKVYDTSRFNFEDVEIIVAGTGASAHIARAAELIEEKGYAPHFTTPRSVADIVEDSMGAMKERYGSLELELMVAVFCKNYPRTEEPSHPIALFNVVPPERHEDIGVAEPVVDYAAIGSGGLFARYLLNRLHDEENPTKNLSIDEAIKEAVYVIEEVKKVDLWCGGPTQLAFISKSGNTYVLQRKKPNEIKAIVDGFAASDERAKTYQRKIFKQTISASATSS